MLLIIERFVKPSSTSARDASETKIIYKNVTMSRNLLKKAHNLYETKIILPWDKKNSEMFEILTTLLRKFKSIPDTDLVDDLSQMSQSNELQCCGKKQDEL